MTREPTNKEREIVNAMTEMVIMAATHKWFKSKTPNEIGEWICSQLTSCGVEAKPVGALHTYIMTIKE